MPAVFAIHRSKDDRFYFVLTAENSEPILHSEMYSSKSSARKGIRSVKANASKDPAFVRRKSSRGQNYFVLLAANRKVIGSGEMYSSAGAMENGIRAVRRVARRAPERDLSKKARG
ncbi:MAG TPA: YegP family protein [Anaerolineales bacterium]|nr:YegP family protein [Anaerolineales bacterium]